MNCYLEKIKERIEKLGYQAIITDLSKRKVKNPIPFKVLHIVIHTIEDGKTKLLDCSKVEEYLTQENIPFYYTEPEKHYIEIYERSPWTSLTRPTHDSMSEDMQIY